ncbi:biopolymer transporter ExbD [Candidatus Cyanaurora vandensis]|uniref:ExbD/TolR family protein n=1 Tax=Candidatus Cyanaurora vandensis TaxID=2714958 RepID=UPI002579E46A|nr:biopolymer transporter ExbD [Candidatus Cyanaurora vandensis]
MAIQSGGRRGRRGGFNEINITPLTDVFLVLVIILLITAPLIQNSSLKVELPSSSSTEKGEQRSLVVTVSADGKYAVNGTIVKGEALVSNIKREARATQQKVLVVNADANSRQKDVIRVMDAARQAGIQKMSLATQRQN